MDDIENESEDQISIKEMLAHVENDSNGTYLD